MNAPWFKRLVLVAAPLLLGLMVLPESALAQCCAPPPCNNCQPPSPPKPVTPCCGSGGHSINVPGVNVNVGASVIVNASASAVVSASGSGAGAGNVVVFGGGGGGGGGIGAGPVTVINALNVEGGGRKERVAYNATRTRIKIIVIRAVCIDDRNVPHAASQVTPDRDIDDRYDGELYRCLAGTRLQATYSEWAGKVDFDKGETLMCRKGEALYYKGGAVVEGGQRAGKMECRPQKAARDCNERSLLRRFGAGVKVIKVVITETYTAYREETVQSAETRSFSMSLDGGVGGIAY